MDDSILAFLAVGGVLASLLGVFSFYLMKRAGKLNKSATLAASKFQVLGVCVCLGSMVLLVVIGIPAAAIAFIPVIVLLARPWGGAKNT